ncbi:hypothetical protein Cyrtocomes_00954 [Candidatus Cyrtobacter comes]|uniref:Uncharacterized protein n=1 Tax=Candidatus Cyrtobacter comes TaxID=675776 RepID=A0ABU5L8X0_9RICK|nr:hypothetical protein [Candidatus Cyrtobacter comes]MDZ5762566.1 hypothetical protein [Candidatus Cyrtobacter comes]
MSDSHNAIISKSDVISSSFFAIRQYTVTDGDAYAFYSGMSKMLAKCITNQGDPQSGIYRPFNPLYSTQNDHHARIGLGIYSQSGDTAQPMSS